MTTTLSTVDMSPCEYESNAEATSIVIEKKPSPLMIDPNLVQIGASSEELNKRIEAFIARKRQQMNILNVQEFCSNRDLDKEKEGCCARVDAQLIRRKDSKSHVKVHKVLNPWGPQIADPSTFYDNASTSATNLRLLDNSALEERLSNADKFLGINGPVPRDVYQRLKDIEDRILHLESISPEYKDFWVTADNASSNNSYRPIRKRTFSSAEIDAKLHELEDKYVKKMK